MPSPIQPITLHLELKRKILTDKSTIGELSVNDIFECYTLEDVVRSEGVKVYGQTAIPTGTYKVVLDFSDRFQKIMPHILDVPNFEGIRIHCGNDASSTDGCLLVGRTKSQDWIGDSKLAFNDLFPKLQKADTIDITIS